MQSRSDSSRVLVATVATAQTQNIHQSTSWWLPGWLVAGCWPAAARFPAAMVARGGCRFAIVRASKPWTKMHYSLGF